MAATTVGSDLRAAAAALAEQYDLHVFPCAPGGKKPACEHGCNDATRDAQRITGWWQHIPNANIGVATGPSNLVVIDLDGDDGLAAWAELLTQNGMHEMTVSSMTGRGGKHLWFRAPEGVTVRSSTRKLGPGLDVRAQGGYVVVPPSVTEGEYEWIMSPEDVDFALLPQPLVDLLQEQPRLSHDAPEDMDLPGGSRVDRWLAKALDRIRDGNTRNVTGYWLACQLRDDGMSLAEATPVMLSYAAAVNAMNGSSHPYETDEARRSLLSAFSRDKRAPAAPPDAPPPPDDDLAPPDWTDTEPPEFDVPPEYVEPETRPKPAPGVGAPEDPWAEGCFVIDAEVAQKLTSFPYTDEGNAQRFALLCASRCRHCREFGWMYWDRTRWLKFADVNAEASAKRVVRTLYAACGHIEDDKRKAFLKHAHATGASGRISGMIRLAEPEPTIMTAAPTYDRQTHVLNTLNGTVDLRDGTLRKHDRDDRITKVAPVRYFRTAQAPRFEQFLYEVFDGKQGLIEFMQRAVGYTSPERPASSACSCATALGRTARASSSKRCATSSATTLGTYRSPRLSRRTAQPAALTLPTFLDSASRSPAKRTAESASTRRASKRSPVRTGSPQRASMGTRSPSSLSPSSGSPSTTCPASATTPTASGDASDWCPSP